MSIILTVSKYTIDNKSKKKKTVVTIVFLQYIFRNNEFNILS